MWPASGSVTALPSANGRVSFDHYPASFAKFKLVADDPTRLRFRINTIYTEAPGQHIRESFGEAGGESPTIDVGGIAFVQAIGIFLEGSDSSLYKISYQVQLTKTHTDNPAFHEDGGPSSGSAGGYAGWTADYFPPPFWIWFSSFVITLTER
jgi:hypothetical protein